MAILKPKAGNKSASFSVRIPQQLADDVRDVQKSAEAAGFVFDSAEIVAKALASAVRSARDELASASPAAIPAARQSGGASA